MTQWTLYFGALACVQENTTASDLFSIHHTTLLGVQELVWLDGYENTPDARLSAAPTLNSLSKNFSHATKDNGIILC